MRTPVDRRVFRDELQRARESYLQRRRCVHLSLRTWSLLHVKAINALLDHPLFGDIDDIKRIVHSFLGYVPSGIKSRRALALAALAVAIQLIAGS